MEVETIVHKILTKSEFEEVHNDPMQLISLHCLSISLFLKWWYGLEQGSIFLCTKANLQKIKMLWC